MTGGFVKDLLVAGKCGIKFSGFQIAITLLDQRGDGGIARYWGWADARFGTEHHHRSADENQHHY